MLDHIFNFIYLLDSFQILYIWLTKNVMWKSYINLLPIWFYQPCYIGLESWWYDVSLPVNNLDSFTVSQRIHESPGATCSYRNIRWCGR